MGTENLEICNNGFQWVGSDQGQTYTFILRLEVLARADALGRKKCMPA